MKTERVRVIVERMRALLEVRDRTRFASLTPLNASELRALAACCVRAADRLDELQSEREQEIEREASGG